ncbi:hypothetical protein CVT25_000894 [Psilocybe cyanescens]|uniref:Chitin synthase export chaperone n=1 Tax=Psilocybe cyanescens TaxID=93625 RepID=A0A409WZ88_PSICY|nr:hypothetical protein CVT25_000894 [Psilocybe cyanescens]
MGMSFGSFNGVCETAALVVCPLVGTAQGVEPTCYSRNVDIGGTLIFQPSTCFVHIVAIIMTAIMILHIRSKYTAVGRKEIVMFFYMYMVIELLAMFLDSGIIPTSSQAYVWFAAVYTGLVAATFCCLLINGFVGFQFAEDGTPLSLWFLRISCLVVFGVSFFVAIATFKQKFGFNYTKPIALFIIYLLWPIICVPIYIVSQLILVFRTLEDRWPIGDIVFGTAFFAGGQVLLFAFSVTICDAIKHYIDGLFFFSLCVLLSVMMVYKYWDDITHYIDGLFFFSLCVLLSVMMVYKYWDDITREDLEFSVGSKAAVWEVKDPLLAPSAGDYDEDTSSERYPNPPPLPGYPSSNGSYSNFSGSGMPQYSQPQAHGYPGFKQQQGPGGPGGNPPSMGKAGRGYPPGNPERY